MTALFICAGVVVAGFVVYCCRPLFSDPVERTKRIVQALTLLRRDAARSIRYPGRATALTDPYLKQSLLTVLPRGRYTRFAFERLIDRYQTAAICFAGLSEQYWSQKELETWCVAACELASCPLLYVRGRLASNQVKEVKRCLMFSTELQHRVSVALVDYVTRLKRACPFPGSVYRKVSAEDGFEPKAPFTFLYHSSSRVDHYTALVECLSRLMQQLENALVADTREGDIVIRYRFYCEPSMVRLDLSLEYRDLPADVLRIRETHQKMAQAISNA